MELGTPWIGTNNSEPKQPGYPHLQCTGHPQAGIRCWEGMDGELVEAFISLNGGNTKERKGKKRK